MLLRFYGTRGSIPVSNQIAQKYGGNTTCLYVEPASGEAIVVDAGSGIRELGTFLLKQQKNMINIIFTHYHWDHIQGFPFFAPVYSKKTNVILHGPDKEVKARRALSYQMSYPYFPTIKFRDLPARFIFKELRTKLKIGSMEIQTIVSNHPNYTRGLKFIENNKSIVFLTDNELNAPKKQTVYSKFVKFIKNANYLIHDAQYTDEIYPTKLGWGHSTHSQVMKLAVDGAVKNVIFTHHDPFSNDEFISKIVEDIQKKYPEHNISAASTEMEIKL